MKKEEFMYSETASTMSTDSHERRRAVENPDRKLSDYQLLRVIGTGTFGKVYLALLKGQPVALKALKKTQIIELKQVDHIKLEKSLLAQIFFPFIVNL
jgi:serine/threonine protein kinase